MKTVEVFKTNVIHPKVAEFILEEIGSHQPKYKCNFDLEDCDKVLRIESEAKRIDTSLIFEILKINKHKCAILE